VQRRQVTKQIKYPHSRYNTRTILYKIDPPFEFNECVAPVCLPEADTSPALPQVKGKCWITGWGTLSYRGEPDKLQEASVDILSNNECRPLDRDECTVEEMEYDLFCRTVDETMICANGCNATQHVPESCTGDTGGPLVCEEGGKWVLHGVTSSEEWFPVGPAGGTVYARVGQSLLLDWVSDTAMADPWEPLAPTPAPPPSYSAAPAGSCAHKVGYGIIHTPAGDCRAMGGAMAGNPADGQWTGCHLDWCVDGLYKAARPGSCTDRVGYGIIHTTVRDCRAMGGAMNGNAADGLWTECHLDWCRSCAGD